MQFIQFISAFDIRTELLMNVIQLIYSFYQFVIYLCFRTCSFDAILWLYCKKHHN